MHFILDNILLGIGLAMDAFSVSLANGLKEPHMQKKKMLKIAATFGAFQFVMPMIGWICVHTIVQLFSSFQVMVPWIGFILLMYIGGGMLKEGFSKKEETDAEKEVSSGKLMVQGLATSIDALSVGFTIASYGIGSALFASILIGIVTFAICAAGVQLGKKFGLRLADKATIFGGFLLIAIGLKILLSSLL